MLKSPFISIIIPTFNRSKFLDNAIHSIIEQDFPSDQYEIIIVDNNSKDDTFPITKKIITEYQKNRDIKYILEKRPGLVYARHTGAFHSKGDILIFGDDDALYEKNWISAIFEVYNKNPDVGAVGTKILIKWDTTPKSWIYEYEELMGKLDLGNQIIIKNNLYINGGSFSIRKEILFLVHGFNPGQKEDYLLGDSETGLCRKLMKQKILIGWTPHTIMWHLQKVEKNGTIEDIKRRYYNNGIAEAFNTLYNYSLPTEIVFKLIINFTTFGKNYFKLLLSLLIRKNHDYFFRSIVLNNAFFYGYIKYIFIYTFNNKIKTEISHKDWEFTKKYSAPKIFLNTRS